LRTYELKSTLWLIIQKLKREVAFRGKRQTSPSRSCLFLKHVDMENRRMDITSKIQQLFLDQAPESSARNLN